MKSLAVLSVLCLIAVTSGKDFSRDRSTQIQIDMMTCARQHSITGEQLLEYKSSRNKPENVKCFINCMFEKVGIIKNGVYQRDTILQRLSEEVGVVDARRIVDACAYTGAPGENDCEVAAKIHECGSEILQKLT